MRRVAPLSVRLRRHVKRLRAAAAAARQRDKSLPCVLGLTIGISVGVLMTMLGV